MVGKPSSKEQEYFISQEMARLRKLREEHNQKLRAEERAKMKAAYYLHCAKCGQHMETTHMEGIEIEICPDCGGIYLDAGELDKILEEKNRGRFSSALALARRLWSGN